MTFAVQAKNWLASHASHVQWVSQLQVIGVHISHLAATSHVSVRFGMLCAESVAILMAEWRKSMAFADKITLGQSAVLGIMYAFFYISCITPNLPFLFWRPGAHLTQNQFNWLGTIFYLSYLAFEVGSNLCFICWVFVHTPLPQYPQNLALQKLPIGKWMRYCMFSKPSKVKWLKG